MKLFFWMILLTSLNQALANNRPCGDYDLIAKVVMREGFPVLLVNPNTKSQIILRATQPERAKLSPYLDRNLKAKITINQPFDHTEATFSLIESMEEVLGDPLSSSNGTSLKLRKKSECRKAK